MANRKTMMLAGGTLFTAFAIGYVMQFGLPGAPAASGPLQVQGITDTAAPAGAKIDAFRLPQDRMVEATLPGAEVQLAALDIDAEPLPAMPAEDTARAGFDCKVTATATPAAGALVTLKMEAPCHGSEAVTVHHNGLMFTQTVQPDGMLSIDVPALSETAVFILSFASGDGAVAQTSVSSLGFYDRVALQWQGAAGLQLHAREMGADYFGDGHVWQGTPGSIEAAARGEGGFLTRLGDATGPDALNAEVYSFPAGTARMGGDVALTVEAEVTARNCGADIDAQTIEWHADAALTVQDLTLAMPGCEAVGDFLVLDEMLRDLVVAAR